MATIDMRSLDSCRALIRSRLLSCEVFKIDDLARVHVAGDLYRCFYLVGPDGSNIWNLTPTFLEIWGITLDELDRIASENEKGTATMKTMSDLLDAPPWCEPSPVFVVSRQGGYFGASAIMDEDIRQKIGELYPLGCFVIPSSQHEVITIGVDEDPKALACMVTQINASDVVPARDKLSDHVYRYEGGRLSLAI